MRIRKQLRYFLPALTVTCLLADQRYSSMIRVADPRIATRLVKGFYATDNPYWRWTAREFSIILNPPKDAANRGAVLVLRYAIVEAVLASVKTMDLSIAVDGVALPRQHYDKSGQFTLRLDVPPAVFRFDPVRVDFTLDKALPPGGREARELGIIVSEVGFESK
jgi:hypothetical protein